MNASITPSSSDAGDAFDRLLRDYFLKEMPAKFPSLPLRTSVSVAVPESPRSWSRGRVVLAVSVLLVAVGCWFALGQRSETVVRPSTGFDGSVGHKKDPFNKSKQPKDDVTSPTHRK